tara:strand:- start:438 stop:563 length:126 start_codon:yes stop_codon:yes gene_type:complete
MAVVEFQQVAARKGRAQHMASARARARARISLAKKPLGRWG